MASIAALHPYARPGASAGLTEPVLRVIEGRRGKPEMLYVRASEVADLVDELTAAGMDMVQMAAHLDMAAKNRRMDLVPDIAERLNRLGVMYRDCAKPTGGAA